MFKITNKDDAIVKYAKEESNILLKNVENTRGVTSSEYIKTEFILKTVIDSCKTIYNSFEITNHQLDIVKLITKIIKGEVLSPLTLNNTEFENGINIRSNRIIRKSDNNIIDLNAYDLYITHAYNANAMKEMVIDNKIVSQNGKININICAGGVTINRAFNACYIPIKTINRHSYTPKEPIHIPVSAIYHDKNIYYIMDKREPKFKALCEFYDVSIFDFDLNNKFDIRKYEKLAKKGI